MKTLEILERLKNGNLDDPQELSNFLVMLSASLKTAADFEVEAEIAYKKKWLELKTVLKADGKEKSDKTIDMEASQTEEFREWRKIRNANEAMQETIMSLKKKLSVSVY